MNHSVIIRRCATLVEAYACCGLLKANGFDATIDNAEHAAQDWTIVQALGGVAIRVPASQYEDAKSCIVETITNAPEVLEAEFGPYEPPKKYGRIAIWTMILIYFGVVQIVGTFLIIWLDTVIPPEWIPEPSHGGAVAYWHIGASIAPPGPGINGLVYILFLILFLGYELIQSKPPPPPESTIRMTLHAPYDPDNIFAKILRGEMPSVKVFEDDIALAFMDVFPQIEGHTLVIPKGVEARNLLDMPQDKLGLFIQRVQIVTRAVEAALKPEGIVVTQFNGAPVGQSVFHLHFHILPRRKGQTIGQHASGEMADMTELEAIAKKIRAELTKT